MNNAKIPFLTAHFHKINETFSFSCHSPEMLLSKIANNAQGDFILNDGTISLSYLFNSSNRQQINSFLSFYQHCLPIPLTKPVSLEIRVNSSSIIQSPSTIRNFETMKKIFSVQSQLAKILAHSQFGFSISEELLSLPNFNGNENIEAIFKIESVKNQQDLIRLLSLFQISRLYLEDENIFSLLMQSEDNFSLTFLNNNALENQLHPIIKDFYAFLKTDERFKRYATLLKANNR